MTDTTAARGVTRRLFAKPVMGWACLILSALLLVLFGYSLYEVVPLLTRPPGFVDRYLEKGGNLEASYLTTLEYESFVIRTQGVQVALGLIVGLLLAVCGLMLFAVGATDSFGAEGGYKEGKLVLQSTAPGLVVLVASAVIIAFAVGKDVRRSFEASFEEGKTPRVISGGMRMPPKSNIGEDSPTKSH